MPVPTTEIPSVDLLLTTGGNPFACTTGATLTTTQTLDDAVYDQAANFKRRTTGMSSWSVQGDGLLDTSGAALLTGHTDGAPLSVTIGGESLRGLTEAGITLSLDLTDVVNATGGLARRLNPGSRAVELALSFDYTDPLAAGNTAWATLLDRLLGVSSGTLAVVVSVGGLSLSFDAIPATASVTKSAGDILKSGVTLSSSGVITNNSTGLSAGISGLLAAYLATDAASPVTVLMSTAETGNSEFTGSAYPASVAITVPYAGQCTVSATLEGSGPLVRQATA